MSKSLRIVTLFLFASLSTLLAQGTITGVVADSAKVDPLIGANVYLVGTALGSVTDIEGKYRIVGVPVGEYTLRISYIGYRTKNLRVQLAEGQTLQRNVRLVSDVAKGISVDVTAQAIGQVAAINQQISAKTIVNVISEEKIQELPDANAAESIGRLPGVSILRSGGEANKVILRGLEDKFTVITVDGVKIPPTDATSRGVDLSTLSQSSLAGIELYKAQTPDKDGDALAGSINLVTKKAPEKREFRLTIKGGHNQLEESAKQYDASFHYGERFFNSLLGIQLAGNIERRIRSNEQIDVNYNQSLDFGRDYFINDFSVEYTDEVRKRDGFSVLVDWNTPDNGTIKLNNVFGRTKRDYFFATRDYPSNGGGSQQGNPTFDYRDREQEINTFTSALTGDNHLIGLNVKWGVSFGQSKGDFPYDYQTIFVGVDAMKYSPMFHDHPERLIGYANTNYSDFGLNWAYNRGQRNLDKERTASLDIARPFTLTSFLSGELKLGGKYKIKDRSNSRFEDFTPYYLGKWQPYEMLPDGTFRDKNFAGTAFAKWASTAISGSGIAIDKFFQDPVSRKIYGSYDLMPIIDKDRMRQWYELNRYGIDKTKNVHEVWNNPLYEYDDYNITERVGAGYVMGTLNLGQFATVIGGVRIEQEDNDYLAGYMPKASSGFPISPNAVRDTTSEASQQVVLPNVNVAIAPFNFMKLRMAAFKALARPDFNMRLDRYIAGRGAEVGSNFEVMVGNPDLKTAEAWNYEVNPTFFSKTIGLISLSAYYKEIDNMYHMLNDFGTTGDTLIQHFGINWASQMLGTSYSLTLPYNSPKPTKVWGFEFEHQVNFNFLPGLLKNIVLSYNASVVRSEAYIYTARLDSVFYDPPGPIKGSWKKFNALDEDKRKLENMPEFFGNIALGYDIGRFSGRISLYHQGEHNVSYSASGLSDVVTNAYTRIDLALKQGITKNIALVLNVNNLTDVEEGNSVRNRVRNWTLFNQSEKYGTTSDFGVTMNF
ncbi:MAG TPA: TonB-dependent receptor [bacterium]|nr:TonB-dependent receptor [bacterium]